MVIGIRVSLLAVTCAVVTGCTGAPEDAQPSPTSEPITTRPSRTTIAYPEESEIKVGGTYRIKLNFMCDVSHLPYGGKYWRADDPLDPDAGRWGSVPVEITYVSSDRLRLVVDKTARKGAGEIITYHRTPEKPPRCE